MDGLEENYAKWNKPEKQIPYDFTYICNLKNKINKTETESQIQRTEGRGVAGLSEKGEGIAKYTLVVTKLSRGCKVQPRKYSQ